MGFKSSKDRGECPHCGIRLDLRNKKLPIHQVKVKRKGKDVRVDCPGSGKDPVNPVWAKN